MIYDNAVKAWYKANPNKILTMEQFQKLSPDQAMGQFLRQGIKDFDISIKRRYETMFDDIKSTHGEVGKWPASWDNTLDSFIGMSRESRKSHLDNAGREVEKVSNVIDSILKKAIGDRSISNLIEKHGDLLRESAELQQELAQYYKFIERRTVVGTAPYPVRDVYTEHQIGRLRERQEDIQNRLNEVNKSLGDTDRLKSTQGITGITVEDIEATRTDLSNLIDFYEGVDDVAGTVPLLERIRDSMTEDLYDALNARVKDRPDLAVRVANLKETYFQGKELIRSKFGNVILKLHADGEHGAIASEIMRLTKSTDDIDKIYELLPGIRRLGTKTRSVCFIDRKRKRRS